MTIEVEDGRPPEWMVALEKKQNRLQQHKLAHDIGAGAPCLNCSSGCSGLDLHFWRKICRNCKCKKEEHDVKEDNSLEHFEILFGDSMKNSNCLKKLSLELKIKLEDILAARGASEKDSNVPLGTKINNELVFDWIPADVPANLASEYLQQIPLEKLPITGSAGAVFRRQQLQKQIPLYDFKMNNCHDLTEEETVAFTEYVDNLKTHAVGKGQITKISGEDAQNNFHLKPPVLPTNLNSSPKPFRSFLGTESATSNEDLPPPPADFLLPSPVDLKPPSAFVPYRKPSPIAPNKSELTNNNVHYSADNVARDKFVESSTPVNGLAAQYSEKLNINEKDTQNNNWCTSNGDRAENKLTPSEIIRKLNGQSATDKAISPTRQLMRNTMSPSINVDGKFVKVTNPVEEFKAISSYVPNEPQISNVLTSARNMNGHLRPQEKLPCPVPHNVVIPENGKEMYCHQCKGAVAPRQVVVVTERAGVEVIWHPQCFVCDICQELLVDLVYFFYRNKIYCGRHYAEVLKIPRCYACDELIFVKEYTMAENQTFHVKHFCCFECDDPLAGKQYIPKDGNPVCLPCYEVKYGKECHFCEQIIKAGDSRVGWNDLSWHATASCFKCIQCYKSLLGGRFVVRNENPLCSKECVVRFDSARVR